MKARLYYDLAWLWPMWGDPATEYRSYCNHIASLLRKHSGREIRSLLNVGCGGGKNVFNLKREFNVTGLDLSPAMVEIARKLNPECAFVQGDMRTFALEKRYDAILIDDAVAYITEEEDLRSLFRRSHEHLSPGGVMIVGPEDTVENFRQNKTDVWLSESHLTPRGVEVTYVVNSYDPDPNDTSYESAMVFLIRQDGKLRIEHDLHILGLFPLGLWKEILCDVGFQVHEEEYREGEEIHKEFVCVKPGGNTGRAG